MAAHSITRTALYARISTANNGQSPEMQLRELREYCERRGWTQRVGWFKDHASGAKRKRGALGTMMDEVREGTVDVVLTWKIDRLARSLNHLAQIIAELQTHNVALVCPSQGIDTTDSNPSAEFQINILAAVAQFERELIIERVNSGIAAAKQRGVKLGRPNKTSAYVQAISDLLKLGRKSSQIARELKLPYSTVTEIVRELSAG